MVSAQDIEKAVAVLRAGGLVAFPTETVYGLGADASNPDALRKIFAAKGRPQDHPLIVHVADAVQLANWARDIPPPAARLAKKFWPGPLTIILRRALHVCDLVTGGQDTVALRVPSHPVAQASPARGRRCCARAGLPQSSWSRRLAQYWWRRMRSRRVPPARWPSTMRRRRR
jgi:L-threonylcarbamoyladenylate synthase